jgi:uroporphyrinogen III methyltransferase/synthase
MFYKLYSDARCIGGVKIACIGPSTAERIKAYHMAVDLMPEKFVAESLVEKFKKDEQMEHLKVLWVRGEEARDVISAGLNKMGAIVDEAFAYRTVAEREDNQGAIARMNEEGADMITFTSSSTVECFFALGLELPKGVKIASIGPVTTKTLKDRGLKVDIEAKEFSIPGLVAAIEKHFA